MFFSTIGLSISNAIKGSSPTQGPGPKSGPGPKQDPSIEDKIKEGLKKFAEWLKEIAKKSAAALPGIIGSIVAFIFRAMCELALFAFKHLILIAIVIVGTIIFGLIEMVTGFKTYKPTSIANPKLLKRKRKRN
jgi:uncharacterized protein YacL